MSRQLSLHAFACVVCLVAASACVSEPLPTETVDVQRVEIRPTDGTGWAENGYGDVEVLSHPSDGGHFRVFYTLEGEDRVPADDTDPQDGVPDYVQMVATNADGAWAVLVDQLGFRAPLDDSVYHERPDYGGDDRFDIYLQNIEQNDGYRVVDVCTEVPFVCAGYLVMENDFAGFHYESTDVATKVLTSHEFAHAILDAYDADMPRTLSEGFATWAEEAVYPEQDDFEGFLPVFFGATERPLDDDTVNQRDVFPYATAIWPLFIVERFGIDVFRTNLEELTDSFGHDPELWETTDAVFRDEAGSNLTDAFVEFTVWNGLTGARAGQVEGAGYAAAANYPEVDIAETEWADGRGDDVLFTHDVSLQRLSATYFALDIGQHGGETVRVEARGRTRFALLPPDGTSFDELVVLNPAGSLDRKEVTLPASGTLLFVAANPLRDRITVEGTLELQRLPDVPDDENTGQPDNNTEANNAGSPFDDPPPPKGGSDDGCSTLPHPARPALVPLLAALAVGLLTLRRRLP